MAKVYKYGFKVLRNHEDAIHLDSMNKNSKWKDAEATELRQLDEYNTFTRVIVLLFPKDLRRFEPILFMT